MTKTFGIIGGSDGPTTIFVAGKLGGGIGILGIILIVLIAIIVTLYTKGRRKR